VDWKAPNVSIDDQTYICISDVVFFLAERPGPEFKNALKPAKPM